ncbi:MAG: right-handed parallel beta-helix repeat-containing protein [Acidobacteriaceae bacterium]|jgi:hypothetical protein
MRFPSNAKLVPLLLAGYLAVAGSVRASGETFYVDATRGRDANDGLSEATAWQTLQRACLQTLKPGDRLLFHAGDSFAGALELKGAGTEAQPVVIGSFGQGAKPKLIGGGAPYAVHVMDMSFVEVSGLDISNAAPKPDIRNGILVEASPGNIVRHVYLRDLDVHDVSGVLGTDATEKNTGGIAFNADGKDKPSHFEDVRVEHCVVSHVDATGIWLSSDAHPNPRSPNWTRDRFLNVVVTGNRLEDIGKNAVIVRYSLAPLIDGNIVRGSAMRLHGNSLMVSYSEGAVLSHNDVSGVQYGGMEGAAFDSDYDDIGTIIEYNYAHDDGGGLVDICMPKNESGFNDGTVVRYNILDGATARVISFDDPATNAMIYNNSIFLSHSDKPHILRLRSFERSAAQKTGVVIANNIFYNEGDSDNEYADGKMYAIVANCFYGKKVRGEPSDPKKISADPEFTQVPPDPNHPERSFALRPGSPCAQSGVPIPSNGGRDFAGNPLPPGNPDRGAIQTNPPPAN